MTAVRSSPRFRCWAIFRCWEFVQTQNDEPAKTELLIFLTPHVIAAPAQLAALAATEKNHMLIPKSYSEQELDRFLDKVPAKKSDSDKSKKKSEY